MTMLKLIVVLFTFVVVGVHGMTDEEINVLKKELDQELANIQSDSSKKDADNIQLATIAKEDDDNHVADSKEAADNALLKLLQAEKDNRDSETAMIDKMMQEELKKDDTNEITKAKKQADDSLTKLLKMENDEDSEAALLELVLRDEEKKEVPMLKVNDDSENENKRSDSDDDSCRDEEADCSIYKPYCESHIAFSSEKCRKTCKFCTPCKKDKWSRCKIFEKHGYCSSEKYKDILEANCHQTCGYCRVPSPPACMNTAGGCCWDLVTPVEKGCRKCENYPGLKNLCKTFKSDCGKKNKAGKFMNFHCPVTCNLCNWKPRKQQKACLESALMKKICLNWKQKGECETKQGIRDTYCPVTCGTCSAGSTNRIFG